MDSVYNSINTYLIGEKKKHAIYPLKRHIPTGFAAISCSPTAFTASIKAPAWLL